MVTSSLIFWSIPGSIIATLLAGYVFDILGRRWTLFSTFGLASIFLFCVPYTAPDVYPWLLLVRVAIGMCVAAPLANPLVAVYVHKDSLGKAASFISIGYILGEVISMGALFTVTEKMNAYMAFLTAACTAASLTLPFLCIVKEPRLRTDKKKKKKRKNFARRISTSGIQMVPASPMGAFRTDISKGFEDYNRDRADSDIYQMNENTGRRETITSNEISDEGFQKLSFCKKIGLLSKQLCKACGKNKTLIVCFVGSSVTKLYSVLFSNFWLLFITSFIGTTVKDELQAAHIYKYCMMVSVVVGCALMPFAGKFADSVRPSITLPVAFLFRASACIAFRFIKNPGGIYAYIVSIFLVTATGCETICLDTLIYR